MSKNTQLFFGSVMLLSGATAFAVSSNPFEDPTCLAPSFGTYKVKLVQQLDGILKDVNYQRAIDKIKISTTPKSNIDTYINLINQKVAPINNGILKGISDLDSKYVDTYKGVPGYARIGQLVPLQTYTASGKSAQEYLTYLEAYGGRNGSASDHSPAWIKHMVNGWFINPNSGYLNCNPK